MEYDQNNQADEGGGLIERIKESPRTVSALIIILIVAAAIYAFSGEQPSQVAQEETATPTTEETATQAEQTPQDSPTQQAVTREELRDAVETLPEAQRTDEGFVEVAQKGDGITHLARRAATRWLATNDAGYEVTNEHRVYIEDYIQNRIGTGALSLDESKTISFQLIQEAVTAAGQLTDPQLRNLTQYTPALT